VIAPPPVIPVPASVTPPAISGTARAGQLLSASQGIWSEGPTTFAYAWERCDAIGGNCQAITGASGQTYLLSAADVGATIRVVETASNASGPGSPASSTPTGVVQHASGRRRTPAPGVVLLYEHVNSRRHSARFGFKATGRSAGFQCALARTPSRKGARTPSPKYSACGTPKTFKNLNPGRYRLYVRLAGRRGAAGTPASYTFKIA